MSYLDLIAVDRQLRRIKVNSVEIDWTNCFKIFDEIFPILLSAPPATIESMVVEEDIEITTIFIFILEQ